MTIGDWIEEMPEPLAGYIKAWRESSKPTEKDVDGLAEGAVESGAT